jgi:hypothetical protein
MLRRPITFAIFICAITFFIVGCSKSAQDYYPIKENTTMKYKYVIEKRVRANFNSSSIDVIKTDNEWERVFLAPEKLKEKEVFPIKNSMNNRISGNQYVIKEKDGFAIYAVKTANAKEPKIYNNPMYFIKYPIEVGNKWDRDEEMGNVSERYPVKLVCNIDSITDSVSVPFGVFEKCLKVKCEGHKEVSIPLVGTIKLSKSLIMWFAPGVGYVKAESVDSSSLDTIPTITTYIELILKN